MDCTYVIWVHPVMTHDQSLTAPRFLELTALDHVLALNLTRANFFALLLEHETTVAIFKNALQKGSK